MKILNRNTFTEEKVTFKKVEKESTLIYIGGACYSLQDLEYVISKVKLKDLNESLNYMVKNYLTNE